ncbi:tRNA (cytidine(34)-2'-O)-methyltransferase [Parvibaculum sp.]|jgi:tRNA (cytidine/uridine-2'-O-)-methyltransferase|uniref:tRNA (cytidine(34)-2'-O)-methyltransferase n=1 Tax=Parvibaculum sp. TaxID=2024848 RepID=UPI000C49F563|nr:tRNA (cytidine(34)-2'-O)-methyltransferase [Parvibaculum sp.]MAM94309.1 tRNA methyltransferase [Parvibaculum sp.]HCX68615.1 tRNA methyltransferase [Rhodobiaceae bacterium]|tara:strand:- start:153 stop:623 length:471 start_codon:yes stop_codon:yes gene_type:complete
MRLALYEPDIPPNAGTLIRLGACLDVPVDIIEPCGFPWGDRDLKRAAMDYGRLGEVIRHASWESFLTSKPPEARIVLLTTKTQTRFLDFAYRPSDILLVGRESAGVPGHVHEAADARVTIPMMPPARSLNVALAASMVISEALRQTNTFPPPPSGG